MRAGASDYLLKGNLARLGPAIDRELREYESRMRQRSTEDRQRKLEGAIQAILVGTASSIGVDFFRSLVRELARSLGVKIAMVGRITATGGSHIRITAIHGADEIPEGFDYSIDNSSASVLMREGHIVIDDIGSTDVVSHRFANAHGVRSLIGIRLDATGGTPIGILAVFNDKPITDEALARDILSIFGARAGSEFERLQAEEERNNLQEQLWHSQKLEAIGTLAGGIAHDINNILSSIWGHAQILEMRKSVAESDQESLSGILSACRRARDLVRQILSFSRKSPPETKVVHLGEIVQETISLLKSTIHPTIAIQCVVDPSSSCVKADPNQMHQVLMNLCTNAIHSMEGGGGTLSVGVEAHDEGGVEYTRIRVSDTGSGIPDNVIDRIFEPFFTTKGAGSGTGLGLSVVHGIVRNHGGRIQVKSQPGIGTTFFVDLPAVTSRCDSNSSPGSDSGIPLGSSQRILVVDDEVGVSDVLCQLLEILGYAPTAFSDPKEALRVFKERPLDWDAVITDRTMPSMSGEQLSAHIHEIRSDIPIVMSSGYEGEIGRKELATRGIRELLPKPFQASDLAIVLRRILHR
jgi:signal transduction histidine kinase